MSDIYCFFGSLAGLEPMAGWFWLTDLVFDTPNPDSFENLVNYPIPLKL